MKPFRRKNPGRGVCVRVFFIWMLLLAAESSRADLPPNTACPLDFFTNVASRLLSSEMHMDLDHIQVYPTNQYTPAVHRLLQVTANIYDATTTNCYPSVFRPLFWKTNELDGEGVAETNVYIAGYQYVQEPVSNNTSILSFPVEPAAVAIGLSDTNVWGVPWVIGVKKGLPNFNAFELDNCVYIERKLQFNRNNAEIAPAGALFPFGRIYWTNQMYILGISNILSVEDWNSYEESYTNPVTVVAQDALSVGLTNDANFSYVSSYFTNGLYQSIQTSPWLGTKPVFSASFIYPLGTNVSVPLNLGQASSLVSPPSVNNEYAYLDGSGITFTDLAGINYTAPCFIPVSGFAGSYLNYLNSGTPPLPQFGLTITNHLRAYILDDGQNGATGPYYILDYVQLGGMQSSLNINQAIADPDSTEVVNGQGGGLWSTNFYDGGTTPFGVIEQYLVSMGGAYPIFDDDEGGSGAGNPGWTTAAIPGTASTAPAAQIAFFLAFFSPSDLALYESGNGTLILSNTLLSVQAPFTASRLVVQRLVYEANDPLVHYLTSDLNDLMDETNGPVSQSSPVIARAMGHVNDRYMPWGTEGNLANWVADNNPCNLAYKDPLVSSSDGWAFPTNQSLNASWLGQIHRGTPWQTMFLKSTNILDLTQPIFWMGLNTWELWTGDTNPADAVSMAPIQDWHLAALLASLFNTNDIASLFSVNDGSAGDWESLLNGMTVLTNNLPDLVVGFGVTRFAALTISSNTVQAATIAGAIQSARANSPGGVIANVGDIFAVPQLSDDSPYLNTDLAQTEHGISDAAYEAIPSQLLPLLWEDSVGSVSPADGQIVFQFTGDDNHAYAIQVSSDLRTWTTVGTNCPVNGIFAVTNTAAVGPRFYRTVLVQ